MPGLHAQLTSSELARAIQATQTLCSLEPYIDRLTWVKIDTLRADLLAEREDRARLAHA
jgi:hypothetical protein